MPDKYTKHYSVPTTGNDLIVQTLHPVFDSEVNIWQLEALDLKYTRGARTDLVTHGRTLPEGGRLCLKPGLYQGRHDVLEANMRGLPSVPA